MASVRHHGQRSDNLCARHPSASRWHRGPRPARLPATNSSGHRGAGVADLINLNCSAAGITSLAGLAQFDQIRSLKLSGNTIRNLLELARLEDLEQLWLDDNDIIDPVPVLRMTSLRALDLDGNPQLQCPSSDKIPLNLQLNLPDHCNAT